MTNLFYGALAYFPIVMVSTGLVLLVAYMTMRVIKKNKIKCLLIAGLICLSTVFIYYCLFFISIYKGWFPDPK